MTFSFLFLKKVLSLLVVTSTACVFEKSAGLFSYSRELRHLYTAVLYSWFVINADKYLMMVAQKRWIKWIKPLNPFGSKAMQNFNMVWRRKWHRSFVIEVTRGSMTPYKLKPVILSPNKLMTFCITLFIIHSFIGSFSAYLWVSTMW